MASIQIIAKVEGIDGLIRHFTNARNAIRDVAKQKLAEDAQILASQIEERAPRGETGELEISVDARKKSDFYWIVVAGNAATRNDRGYNYARAVEFGTVKMAAEPFFFPQYRRFRSWHRKEMKKAAADVIRGFSA